MEDRVGMGKTIELPCVKLHAYLSHRIFKVNSYSDVTALSREVHVDMHICADGEHVNQVSPNTYKP